MNDRLKEMRVLTACWSITTATLAAMEETLVPRALTKEERKYLDNAMRNLDKLQKKLEEDMVDVEAEILKELDG